MSNENEPNPAKRIHYTGDALVQFITAAHGVMFDPHAHPAVPHIEGYFSNVDPVKAGEHFGTTVRFARDLSFGRMDHADMSTLNEAQLETWMTTGFAVWDGDTYTSENSIIDFAPIVVRRLVDSYIRLRNDVEVLAAMDNIYTFMEQDVGKLARNSTGHELPMRYASNMSYMKFIKATTIKNTNIPDLPHDASFAQISERLLAMDLERTLGLVDLHVVSDEA